MLVLKWAVVGFMLTMSYKSVLRAMLMTVEYEETIDTIDGMLNSDRKFMLAGDTPIRSMLEGDPREKVKQLAKVVEYYSLGKGFNESEWVAKG